MSLGSQSGLLNWSSRLKAMLIILEKLSLYPVGFKDLVQ
jgi:hypothetical protein